MGIATYKGTGNRSLVVGWRPRRAALSMVLAVASLAAGQTEQSVRGLLVTKDSQPIPGVLIYGSKRWWPEKQDKVTTNEKGEFFLEHAGTVIHLSKSGLQPFTFVVKPGTSQVRIVMGPTENELTVPTCVRPVSTQRLIGWGKYGLHFAVPKDGVNILGGKPDVDYVRHVIKPRKSGSYLELWFGRNSISTEPDDEQFVNSVEFSQRNLFSAKRGVIGMDSRGRASSGLN